MAIATLASSLFFLVSPLPGDVVGPPPESCPTGGQPNSCHGGPFCAVAACESDSDCSGGDVCQSASLCLGSIGCAGMLPEGADPSDFDVDTLIGTCSEFCDNCQTRKVCAPPGSTPGSSSGGGCAGGAASGPWLFALAGLALALLRRRRAA